MEHIISCREVNGLVEVEPYCLRVKPGDTVIWHNLLSDPYEVRNLSPSDPPLFGLGTVEIPAGSRSIPAEVMGIPPSGQSLEYRYDLVPVRPCGTSIDPVIIVESPSYPQLEPPGPIPPPPRRERP